ncbi:MAG: ChaN family lipoprotein [Planctomycetes bacterium]|nr:ChaN family lipoprotein [Planctomycetota bacterium]
MKKLQTTFLWILLSMSLLGCRGLPWLAENRHGHPLEGHIRIHSSDSGKLASLEQMIADLSTREVVILGETHLDDVTHRCELAVVAGIHAAGRDVVISMEMFGRDRQSVVNDYLSGVIDEDAFLEQSNPWNNYETGYRPILEWAKQQGVPVIAANVPASVWRKVAFGGGLTALDESTRATIAEKLLANTERYWQRYDRTVRGHGHVSPGATVEDRLEKVQSLWDNTMGESVVRALEQFPGSVVVHINGGFHSLERDGAARQVLLRRPSTDLATVHITPAIELPSVVVEAGDPRADWIVDTELIARGLNSGSLAIYLPRTLRYRIDAPARSDGPAPLLVWLPDEESAPAEELERLREALGESACIVVVEPMYSAGSGGAWVAPDHRDEDLAMLSFGLERLRKVLLVQRNVAADQVVLAGSGSGGEAVASVVIGDSDWPLAMVALDGPPGWFGMEGLPDPPESGDEHPGPGLLAIVTEENAEAWRTEAQARAQVGAPLQIEVPVDNGGIEDALLDQLRRALQR